MAVFLTILKVAGLIVGGALGIIIMVALIIIGPYLMWEHFEFKTPKQ